jgi:zinc transport system ATP-binding protein
MLSYKQTILEVKNLCFSYNNKDNENILENINLNIEEKDFLAIIGPNGGGKSTLLKLILNLYKPRIGSIDILDKNIKIGYVPQNTNININFPIRVIDVVMIGDIQSSNSKQKALDILQLVDMQEYAYNKIGALSGGERQKIMIARALFSSPNLLCLDEPTANIDKSSQKKIYDLLKRLNQDMTIIVISHDISVVLEYAKRVAYINQTLTMHNIDSLTKPSSSECEHFCEVEMLEMLGKNR